MKISDKFKDYILSIQQANPLNTVVVDPDSAPASKSEIQEDQQQTPDASEKKAEDKNKDKKEEIIEEEHNKTQEQGQEQGQGQTQEGAQAPDGQAVTVEISKEQDAKEESGFDVPNNISFGEFTDVNSIPRDLGIEFKLYIPNNLYLPPPRQFISQESDTCCVHDLPIELIYNGTLIFTGDRRVTYEDYFALGAQRADVGTEVQNDWNCDSCCCCLVPPEPEPNYWFTYTNCEGEAYVDLYIKFHDKYCDEYEEAQVREVSQWESNECYTIEHYQIEFLPGFEPECGCNIESVMSNVINAYSVYNFVDNFSGGGPQVADFDGYRNYSTHFMDKCGVCWSIVEYREDGNGEAINERSENQLYLVPICVKEGEFDSICSYSRSDNSTNENFYSNDGYYYYQNNTTNVYFDADVSLGFVEILGDTLLIFNVSLYWSGQFLGDSTYQTLIVDLPDNMGFDSSCIEQFILCSEEYYQNIFNNEFNTLVNSGFEELTQNSEISDETSLLMATYFLESYASNIQDPNNQPGFGVLEDNLNNTYGLCYDGTINLTPYQLPVPIPTSDEPLIYLTNVTLCTSKEADIINIPLEICYCGSDVQERYNVWKETYCGDLPEDAVIYGDPFQFVEKYINAHYVNDGTQQYIEINYPYLNNYVSDGFYESYNETFRFCLDDEIVITEMCFNADALFENYYYNNGFVDFWSLLSPYGNSDVSFKDENGECYQVEYSGYGDDDDDDDDSDMTCYYELEPCECEHEINVAAVNPTSNIYLNGNSISASVAETSYNFQFDFNYAEGSAYVEFNYNYGEQVLNIQISDEFGLDCCCSVNDIIFDASALYDYLASGGNVKSAEDILNYWVDGGLMFLDCDKNCYDLSSVLIEELEQNQFSLASCDDCCSSTIAVELLENENPEPVPAAQLGVEQACETSAFNQFFEFTFNDCGEIRYIDFTWHYNYPYWNDYYANTSCQSDCEQIPSPEDCFNFPRYSDSIIITIPEEIDSLSCDCELTLKLPDNEYYAQFFEDCQTLSDIVYSATGYEFIGNLMCDRAIFESECGNYIIDRSCYGKNEYVLVEVGNTLTTTTLTDENYFEHTAINSFMTFDNAYSYALEGDGGEGLSLREAIILANNAFDLWGTKIDTLLLQSGTYDLTIDGDDNTSAFGDLDILTDLQIIGGCKGTTIDAKPVDAEQGIDRIFEIGLVEPNEGEEVTVTLRGLTLQNGYRADVPSDFGGGILLNYASDLNLYSTIVQDCSVGIYDSENELSTIGSGGAIYGVGENTITMNDCSAVQSNYASLSGGGIFLSGDSTLEVNDSSRIDGNVARAFGGGMYAYLSSISLNDNSLIKFNSVEDGDGGGGGITLEESTVTMNDVSNIASNTANSGAAIFDRYESSIYLNDLSSITLNTSNSSGAVYLNSQSFPTASILELNDASHISYNNADYGGGVYANSRSLITLNNNSLIEGNYAGVIGGGLYIIDSNLTLNDYSQLANNGAEDGGGGIYATTSEGPTEITLNDDSAVFNNSASEYGGGILGYDTIITLSDKSSIHSNGADNGGGLYIVDSTLTLNNNSTITYNYADFNGGGVFVVGSDITLNDSSFITQNTADYDLDNIGTGGGIYNNGVSTINGVASVTGNSPDDIAPPIVFDLNHDKVINLIALEQSKVSWLLNGEQRQTAWVGPEDGLLIYDKNQNSHVDDVSEFMLSLYHPEAKTDLDGLRLAFDSNHDNVFDNQDNQFKDFGVWQDLNSDGKTDDGEYRSLIDWGVQSISLSSDNESSIQSGNVIFGSTTYKMADGAEHRAADVGLAVGDVIRPIDEIDLSSLGNTVNCTQSCTAATSNSNERHAVPPVVVEHIIEEAPPVVCS